MSGTTALVVSLLLLAANAWFVLFEFALVRMRGSRLEELETNGVRNAAAARRMHDHMNDYLGACQLGITIASLGLGWLGEPALSAMLEPALGSLSHGVAVAIAFTFITFLHIVYGELVPKAAAIVAPERALLWSVKPMQVFHLVFFLPLRLLNAIANVSLRVFGLRVNVHEEPSLSVEEMRIVVTDAYRQGEVSLDRSMLIENALDFETLNVGDAMTPITRAVTVDLQDTWEETARTMERHRLSRYLLTDGGPDTIVGYIHVKDVALKDEVSLADIRRELIKVSASMPLDVVLRRFQRERAQIALVTGDGGEPLGLVTLEDVLEELVGEVHDEFEEIRVWNLADHVDKGALSVDATLASRDEAIRTLVQLICASAPEVKPTIAVQAVMKREEQASTAVGHEVAVPHARIAGLRRTHVAMARLASPISWRKGSDPVRFIFLILTPAETPLEQNRALWRVATLVRDELLFARLDEAPTPDAMMEVIRAADVVA